MPSVDTVAKTRLRRFLQSLNQAAARRTRPSWFCQSPSGRRGSEISDRPAVWLFLWCLLLVGRPALAADKVDAVYLKNGDRLTCEIKKLDRSVLTVSTDPLGTASVHWGEIVALTSPRMLEVQTVAGDYFYGSLLPAPPGKLVVGQAGGPPIELAMEEVIRLTPIGASVWSRMDGSLDAGFSFAQANLETHYTLNAAATYRSRKYQFGVNGASQLTTREDADRLSRNNLSLTGMRSFDNRWYGIVWGSLQQNEELALDFRALGGGGVGRDLVHTTHRLWSLYGGLVYTHEQFSGEPADESAEAAVGGQIDFFTPGSEDFKITNAIVSYFNLSRARVRLELQSAWRHEFWKDLYWSLNGFDSFDSDPPAEEKQNDFGVSFTLGWKF